MEWLKTPSGAYNLTLILAILGWIITGIAIFAGFNHYKVRAAESQKQAEDIELKRKAIQQELSETKVILEKTQVQASELSSELNRIKTPRTLSKEQKNNLVKKLKKYQPKGPIIVTFLSVESDAEMYARQFVEVFREAGFDVDLSMYMWLQLAFDGVFMCARKKNAVPLHGPIIQQVLIGEGIPVIGHYDEDFMNKLKVPEDGIVLVISNK